jgi:hypothetical protein
MELASTRPAITAGISLPVIVISSGRFAAVSPRRGGYGSIS